MHLIELELAELNIMMSSANARGGINFKHFLSSKDFIFCFTNFMEDITKGSYLNHANHGRRNFKQQHPLLVMAGSPKPSCLQCLMNYVARIRIRVSDTARTRQNGVDKGKGAAY